MRNLTIRTRLMLILIGVGILACAVLGILGSQYGQKAISAEVQKQLNLTLNAKRNEIGTYLHDISSFVEVQGQNTMVIDAAKEFRQAFNTLEKDSLNLECSIALSQFYDQFLVKMSQTLKVKNDVELYLPKSKEACYLQFHYIVDNPNPVGNKIDLNQAEDNSRYSAIHAKYHSYFSLLLDKYNFYDVFLIDLEQGNIVYTAHKETDFATNLYNGPYRNSNLATLTKKLRSEGDLQATTWVDFASYRPSFGAPAAFCGIPLIDNGITVGALVFQLPIDKINEVMTDNRQWETNGLGTTGESFLVGRDRFMRSSSRFFLEDSVQFKEMLISKGEPPAQIDKMYRFGSTILQLKIKSPSATEALEGRTGDLIETDYRGEQVVTHYAPLQLPGLDWILISKKDILESYIPVSEFNKNMFIQTLILILIITILSLFFANRFVRPIEKLTEGAKELQKGNTDHHIDIHTKDEFGVLATTFNTSIEQIRTNDQKIQEQLQANQKLLENFIPKEYIQKIRKGEREIANEYQQVSLVNIDIVGFGKLTKSLGAKPSLTLLNEIVASFDAAAAKNYIEKIRTVGDTYFAGCGIFEPRLDHAKRMVLFAQEAMQLVTQINLNHNLQLHLQIAIHSGPVMAGIVGSDKFSFDVWGPTVSELFIIHTVSFGNKVVVTNTVADMLSEFYEFEALGKPHKGQHDLFTIRENVAS